jgi:membrane-associated phospholipid phosphatase
MTWFLRLLLVCLEGDEGVSLPRELRLDDLPEGSRPAVAAPVDLPPLLLGAPLPPLAGAQEPAPHDSFTGFFETHFSKIAWRDNVWRDYLTQPPVLFPLFLGVSAAAISHWDEQLSNDFQGQWGNRKWIANDGLAILVSSGVLFPILFPAEGRNSWDQFWNVGESFLITEGITAGLKLAVQRTRPGGGGRNSSFPSGHASAAFCGAALIERNFGWEAGLPAYAIAVVTGLSRIETGDHFPSDVLAGAAIGVLTAEIIDALHWGTGREGVGICGHTLNFSFAPGRSEGMELALTVRF